jgi:hypothetical protein
MKGKNHRENSPGGFFIASWVTKIATDYEPNP